MIPNDILDTLILCGLPKEKRKVLDFIIRKTWGWRKEKDQIANSQIVKATGLKRQNVQRALKWLEANNVIFVITSDYKRIKTIGINRKFKSWKIYRANSKNVTTGDYKKASPVITNGSKMSSSVMHTKENINKKKERANPPGKFNDNYPGESLSEADAEQIKIEAQQLIDKLKSLAKKQETNR
jgi:phage replication O-like protein O